MNISLPSPYDRIYFLYQARIFPFNELDHKYNDHQLRKSNTKSNHKTY